MCFILASFNTNRTECISYKSVVWVAKHLKRLVHSVALAIMASNNFVPLLKSLLY